MNAAEAIRSWPEESREAAQLVLDEHGEPDEVTQSQLTWHDAGSWKRIVATRTFYQHNFPAPHIDAVESVIDYHVPVDKFSSLAAFDGSVVVERTAGEVSARCHDLQANNLALNLMHDIVTGARDADEARQYYAKEFADFRRKTGRDRFEVVPALARIGHEPVEIAGEIERRDFAGSFVEGRGVKRAVDVRG